MPEAKRFFLFLLFEGFPFAYAFIVLCPQPLSRFKFRSRLRRCYLDAVSR